MTSEDLELTVRLARWMGWREFQGLTEEPTPGTSFATYGAPDDTLRISRPDAARAGTIEWLPLTRPDHAAEVMAEAVRRGGWLDFVVQPGRIFAHAHLSTGIGEHNERGLGGSEAWCRAVCLAVLRRRKGVRDAGRYQGLLVHLRAGRAGGRVRPASGESVPRLWAPMRLLLRARGAQDGPEGVRRGRGAAAGLPGSPGEGREEISSGGIARAGHALVHHGPLPAGASHPDPI